MAKLVTVIRTYFKSGNYRNNRVEIEIPDEAAELIEKYWKEKQVINSVQARFLASNQSADCSLYFHEKEIGIIDMATVETQENETFEQQFTDTEEDDE